jgi:hypothetical protein
MIEPTIHYLAPDLSEVPIRTGDIFLTRSRSLLGVVIRFFERTKGEGRTVVNHTGLFLGGRQRFSRLDDVTSIEALARVRTGRFWSFYHNNKNVEVAIFRDITLTDAERREIAETALHYQDQLYGGLKLALHAGDWFLSRLLFRSDVYLFRRAALIDWAPICSYLVAKCYQKVGRNFGCEPGAAQPDDIWDYVHAHPERWGPVLSLRRV